MREAEGVGRKRHQRKTFLDVVNEDMKRFVGVQQMEE